jgi:hypothetical protein
MKEGQIFQKVKFSVIRYPLFLSDFKEICTFSTDFRKKKISIIKCHEIWPVGAGLFHADRQTDGRADLTKLTVTVGKFVKALKKRQ